MIPIEGMVQVLLVRIQGWLCLSEECFNHPAKLSGEAHDEGGILEGQKQLQKLDTWRLCVIPVRCGAFRVQGHLALCPFPVFVRMLCRCGAERPFSECGACGPFPDILEITSCMMIMLLLFPITKLRSPNKLGSPLPQAFCSHQHSYCLPIAL